MDNDEQNDARQPSPPEPKVRTGGAGSDRRSAIELKGVTKRFGSNTAVDDVSFSVPRGEVVGFLGPNGSGKTTTMRLITSYYTPDSGSILVDGVDNQASDVETRRKMGYLPENNPLYGDLTVHEYLEFASDLHGLPKRQRKSFIGRAVEEVGIEEVYYRPISQCSKGFKQRVGLAQAILHEPEILVMDEPTEGLDPNQRVPIRELIVSMGAERTVMLSTHVLQEAEAVCDRMLIIARGRIVAQGTADDLREQASTEHSIELEVEGKGVEAELRKLPDLEMVERQRTHEGRERYILSPIGDADLRPEIYNLAKRRDWVLWELHQERARLEDLFHSLTADAAPTVEAD